MRAFEAVARNQSFTIASRELNVTRPAISKQVKLLEEALGNKLIKRAERNFQLTEIGAELYLGLNQAFDQISATVERVVGKVYSANGIKILVERDFASSWLAGIIGDFLIKNPGISVEITAEINGQFHMEADFNYRIFYGLHGNHRQGSLEEIKLCHWIDLPLCAPSYAKEHITNQKFADKTNFLLDKNYNPWKDWFELTGYKDPGNVESGTVFNETTLCLSAAIAGSGITIGDSFLALSLIQAGDLIMPFKYGIKSEETYSIFRTRKVKLSSAEKIFEDWLFSTIKNYQKKVDQYLIENGITIISRSS
ncbi:MAG: LysR family glycine cleavage system transcriptional activator [Gammaproteobacteria bacterium]|jgi:LysR family glycine cleavage system transcriptional activator/LysR family transcriptional regulator of beta-lactamase